MDKIRILILAANPWETKRLGLDEEYQRIQELWEGSDYQGQFELRYYPALRGEALQEKVLKFKPHLIHFSGHGENDSLVFSDLTGDKRCEVTKQALAHLFKSCAPDLKAVFLNACHSAQQADEIIEQVEYVVGMNAAIDDVAAISFSQGFYTAIFTQERLAIEKAFNAGLNQMAIMQISESEQKKPVLQKRRQTFVSAHTYDIGISFAQKDSEWTQNFTDYLRKQLKQKLNTADGFQIYSGSEIAQLQAAALLLFVASPDYLVEHENQLEPLKNLVSQKSAVFLLETDSYKLPDVLKGLSRHKFWHDDDKEGIVPLQGEAYIDKANQVSELIVQKLQELKTQQQSRQRFAEEYQAETETSASILASVFLNSAPEDLQLSQHIKSLLKKNGVMCVLEPMPRTSTLSPQDIRDDIEGKILGCDAVLVLCEQTTAVWASKQIMNCLKLQRKGEASFRIIAVHGGKNHSDLGIDWDMLKTYLCPPQQVESYLHDFISALA